ncbi:unnamed protein product [Meganyctiphanes norvegica]|uniref:Ubiquitin-like protease family profile domain-containing protein n=1 Tax=Meganyctiphanes norvegica TaxID=48144 RepID=A0AAV2QJF2_MEGNR
MQKCKNEQEILHKKEKKEKCKTDQNNSSKQRQVYLKKLETNYSNLNYNISTSRKNMNNNSKMDKIFTKSHNVEEGGRMTSDPNNIINKKKKRKKKDFMSTELFGQDKALLIESDSSQEEGEIIDLKNDNASENKTLGNYSCSKSENSSLAKKSKVRIFDDIDIDDTEISCKNDSLEAVKNISNKDVSNKKKIKSKNKELLSNETRKKLEEIMKRATENKNKTKEMLTLKRKAQSKENHAEELKPTELKESYKRGDKVLVTSFNGEVSGPFLIVELIGSYSCSLRLVNAVQCGENGLFSDENEEKLTIENLENLIPFKKNTKKITNSIKSPCSNEQLGSEHKLESFFPEKQKTATIKQYSNRNKIKININMKKNSNDPKKNESKLVVDWVKSLKLNSNHKEILLNDECCLTTDIIDTANQLIRKKWPYVDGLRTPFQVQCPTGFPAMKSGGVQILFDEEREHWFTASNMREHVEIADSMMPDSLTYSAKKQMVQCFRDYEENGVLKVHMLPVCQQDNEVDCGLYAIANAIEFICENGDPLSSYIRSDMREHLIKCFEQDEILQFSKATIGTAKRSVNQPKKTKVDLILTNSIIDRCERVVKRDCNKPPSDEIIVELSSDSE